MTPTLTLLDKSLYGDVIQKWDVPVKFTSLTLRELIMLRVEEEIRRQNDKATEQYFTKLAASPEAERLLNRNSPPDEAQQPDPEAHGYRALDAFRKNAFFVLVDNKQVGDLEARIELGANTSVSFVRLTPLVGG